jgi:hypothetical protein
MGKIRYSGGRALGAFALLLALLSQALAAGSVAARERQDDWGVELIEGKSAGSARKARTAYDALMQMLEGSGLVPRTGSARRSGPSG